MNLTLNIYDGKNVVKTYEAEDFTLTTGVCEDIIKEIDIDKLTSGKLDQTALGMEVLKLVAKSFSKFKPFLQNVFDGLTDEEYRNTSIKEVAGNVVKIVQYTVGELFSIGSNSKN